LEAAVFVTDRFPTLGIWLARLALVESPVREEAARSFINSRVASTLRRVGTGMGMEIAHARTRNTSLAGRLSTLCDRLLR
jgi:hypothetical protein